MIPRIAGGEVVGTVLEGKGQAENIGNFGTTFFLDPIDGEKPFSGTINFLMKDGLLNGHLLNAVFFNAKCMDFNCQITAAIIGGTGPFVETKGALCISMERLRKGQKDLQQWTLKWKATSSRRTSCNTLGSKRTIYVGLNSSGVQRKARPFIENNVAARLLIQFLKK